MLFLALLMTVLSVLVTFFVAFANGMSSAPTVAFQGKGIIITAWLITAALYVAWLVG